MAKRPRHPNKDIEAAVQHAEAASWVWSKGKGHCWGRLKCPSGKRGGCQFSIWSTPKNPVAHARQILKRVGDCPH
jgi:hypothetical protein